MSTRAIRPSTTYSACDICGRTLLRGEHAEPYLAAAGVRRSVCELCKPRALREGWIREGTVPNYELGGGSTERRRSLLSRLRGRGNGSRNGGSSRSGESSVWDELERPPGPAPAPAAPQRRREPRHVHAIPTSVQHRSAEAVEAFNVSEHRRTIAGVARSLGVPSVSVQPVAEHPNIVSLVVAWELCWYRYEVDLADELPTVRLAGQGYELDELAAEELEPNALADEHGALELAA